MTATFYVGDAVTVMNTLPAGSVDLVLSSPPFLSLRSYLPVDHPDKTLEGGSEASPGEYIDWLLGVVEACARVLAPHGSLVFELGDTYSGGWIGNSTPIDDRLNSEGGPRIQDRRRTTHVKRNKLRESNLRGWAMPKSLSLIPETFRFAMVYGYNPHTGRTTPPWRLRNVIRWVRPNPPVGALGDKFRPATSELMVFCKSKDRFFDLDAVREPVQYPGQTATRAGTKLDNAALGMRRGDLGKYDASMSSGAPPLDWWNIPPGGYSGGHYAVFPKELLVKPIKAMCPEKVCRRCGEASRRISEAGSTELIGSVIREAREGLNLGRADLVPLFLSHYKNADSITAQISNWELGKNVPMAHDWELLKGRLGFGDEWDHLIPDRDAVEYVTEEGQALKPGNRRTGGIGYDRGGGPPAVANRIKANRMAPDRFSDCSHDDYRPGLVLDPFAGSGTTLAVATGHGRDAIGIDLDERNYELALDRVGPLILERGTEPARRINS